jgi:hypothetical protein
MKCWRRFSWLVTMMMVTGSGAAAQEISASLQGVVLDASGGVVGKATVTATQEETGLKRSTVSDAQGSYVLLELPGGITGSKRKAEGSRNTFSKEFR